MISTYLQVLCLLLFGTQARLSRVRKDTGSVSLEQVVIALALFLAASAVVGVITNAIMSRANQIG